MKLVHNILSTSGWPRVVQASGQQPVYFNYNPVGDNTKVYSSLPSTGSRNCDGKVIVMKVQGFYWTSTMSYSSDLAYTLNYSGTLGFLYTLDHKICYGAAVRLVKKK